MTRTTRPLAMACNGMVSSPHYLASTAGLQVLQEGGSAVDAAVAVNATLGVVYPHMTGPGGDAFWLIHDAESGQVHGLNGSGRAIAAATREHYRSLGHHQEIPSRGPLAVVTVPGAVDSWCTAHEQYGRLPFERLLQPAINYATSGFAVCDGHASCTRDVADVLRAHSTTSSSMLPGGRAPLAGDLLALPHLAETLRTVAEKGRAGFYEGPVAAEIAAAVQRAGGLVTAEDLAGHRSDWTEPISTTYRGYTCYQHPPNSQGFAHLMILNILENFDVAGMDHLGPEYIHLLVEATKLAFADRDRYLTDPEFGDIPLEQLLSKDYAAELSTRVGSTADLPLAAAPRLGGDTTCSVVVDSDGNAASVIQSLYHEFGSGFVGGETGVLLQNRGSFFSLDDEHPNRLEPGKRTFHTLMPGMLLRDGKPDLVYGTMGGEGQPQTSTALVTRIVDAGCDVQTAIDSPRWLYGRTWGDSRQDLRVESRFPATTEDGLVDRGHPVRVVEPFDDAMGHAQAIRIGEQVLAGGADPRGEGLALGW
ncbi:gamma-glutamyltransferase [Pseudonocardia parietis]|uniref:Glutathione hydrolase proenzyme n=1 Tax=Pseudonocardia parietis TaxID=570936 RepID=A0ABS4VVM3_9PSEU|nr:gamma-glutamyltransferase [Pseudonocardia parietis]MBP2367969.1 gamma-glutamyltranspeptidase/glutathione hydrolase [Pseudonocardia parietis]